MKINANGDRGVSHVKRPEVPAVPVGIDEIQHVAAGRAIDQVADRPAQHAGDADPRQPVAERHRRSVPCDAAERDRGHERQHDRLERKFHAVQHAERGAGVVHARQVEKAGDHFRALVQRQRRTDHRLGDLVEDDHRRRRTISFEPSATRALQAHRFSKRVDASRTEAGAIGLGADFRHVAPAALAFCARGSIDRHG